MVKTEVCCNFFWKVLFTESTHLAALFIYFCMVLEFLVVIVTQVAGTPVVMRKCFIPLNPVRFSSAMLDEMENIVPSHPKISECVAVSHGKQVYFKRV